MQGMTEAHMHAISELEGNRFVRTFVDALSSNEECSKDYHKHFKKSKILTEMGDINMALKEECKETSSVKWLHRIILGEDGEHNEYILRKLDLVTDLLGSRSSEDYADLKQRIANFSRERRMLQERNQKVLKDLEMGPQGHIENLPKVVKDICDGHMSHLSDIQGEQREALFQAAAYAQALSEQGEHLRIEHPDLLVMWHRNEALRHNSKVDWSVFRSSFPAELVVPSDLKTKIMNTVDKILDPLEKCLTSNLQAAGSLQTAAEQVSIDSINELFPWNKLRRTRILEALEECQTLSATSASSTISGPSTPCSSDSLEKLRSTSLSSCSTASFTALASSAETEFVGRKADLKRVVGLLTAYKQPFLATKRHVLLSGSSGIGKTTLGDKVAEELKGEFQVINVDFFSTATNTADEVHERFLSALGIKATKSEGSIDADKEDGCQGGWVKADIINCLKHYKSSRPGAQKLLLRLEACEIPLANEDAAEALLGLVRDVSRHVPHASMLMAVRTSGDDQMLQRFLVEGFEE
ncbi:hypothetical protein DUNSADRAFT_15008, partial [Dunaliella salina]